MATQKKYKKSIFVILFTKISAILPMLLRYRPKVYYEDKSVQGGWLKGGTILMANHMAFWDFIIFEMIFYWQRIRFVVAEVLFNRHPMLNRILYRLDSIRLDRDASDFSWMAETIRTVEKGGHVIIFPQGRLPVKGQPTFPYKPGIVYAAMHTDAPIIPIYNDGNYAFWNRVRVIIGKPIYLKEWCSNPNPDKEEILALTKRLEDKTYELKALLEEKSKKRK